MSLEATFVKRLVPEAASLSASELELELDAVKQASRELIVRRAGWILMAALVSSFLICFAVPLLVLYRADRAGAWSAILIVPTVLMGTIIRAFLSSKVLAPELRRRLRMRPFRTPPGAAARR